MQKSQRTAITEKFEKLKCPQSQKDVKNSKLSGHRKMSKTQGSADKEKFRKLKRLTYAEENVRKLFTATQH